MLSAPGVSGADVPPKSDSAPAEAGVLKSASLAALPSTGPATPRPKSETTFPGGISPAIVYLQSVKSQLEMLEKEVANLKSLASKQSGQEELILKKLGELSDQIKASASRPAPSAPVQTRPPSAAVSVAAQTRSPVRTAPAPVLAPSGPITLPPSTIPSAGAAPARRSRAEPVVLAPEAVAPEPVAASASAERPSIVPMASPREAPPRTR